MSSTAMARSSAPAQVRFRFPQYGGSGHHYRNYLRDVEGVCEVLIPGGGLVQVILADDTIHIQTPGSDYREFHWSWDENSTPKLDPFVQIEALGPAYTKEVMGYGTARPTQHRHGYYYGRHHRTPNVKMTDCYDSSGHSCTSTYFLGWNSHYSDPNDLIPYQYLRVRVTYNGQTAEGELRFRMPLGGTFDPATTRGTGIGFVVEFHGARLNTVTDVTSNGYGHQNWWDRIRQMIMETRPEDRDLVWEATFKALTDTVERAGIKGIEGRKGPKAILAQLATDAPAEFALYEWLHDKGSIDKATTNQLLAAFLKENTTYKAVRDGLRALLDDPTADIENIGDYKHGDQRRVKRALALRLPGGGDAYMEKRAKSGERAAFQWMKKTTEQAEALGFSEAKFPLLWKAVVDGEIPIGVFHEPGDKNHLVNMEFDLLEWALGQGENWRTAIYGIAKNCASRGTYTHRFTSYLAFLRELGPYLDEHAPRPKKTPRSRKRPLWKVEPLFRDSQSDLDLDTQTDSGTTTTRDAMTPLVDNKTGVVQVPYAAMSVSGAYTTWMYSDKYYLVRRGLNDPIGDGVWTKDLEVGLNGRDDYGLCFYTLTGTSRNTGYPTFLIIFERLVERQEDTGLETRVHFHRTHPCRSKNGKPTPTPMLIQRCYQNMAGNVKAEDIRAQQGDLIFIYMGDKEPKQRKLGDRQPALAFESHAFVPQTVGAPVEIIQSEAKAPTNRLAFLRCDRTFDVRHPEHEDIVGLEPGWYDVRRCKSWSALATGVWSLTID